MNEALTPPLPVGRPTVEEAEAPPLSLTDLAWRRFRRHKLAIVGLITLVLMFVYAFGGTVFYTEKDSNHNDTKRKLLAPSSENPFGTDEIGRDVLARTIYGGQISLIIGIAAVTLEVFLGVMIGALAGYFGGLIDGILMRFTEAMLCIPQIFLLIVMAKFFAGSIPNINLLGRTFSGSVVVIVFIIGVTSWPYLARIVRAEFLSIKENEFILAARATGTPTYEIIFRHILPNTIAPIIVSATLGVASAILSEAYVSFLGLGVQAPTATWGNMVESARHYIGTSNEDKYWVWLFPSALILLTVLSINFVGDGLRDALDPRSRAA